VPIASDVALSPSWKTILATFGARLGKRTLDAFRRRPPEELYDLAADPDEIVNIASDAAHASMLADVRAQLEHGARRRTIHGARRHRSVWTTRADEGKTLASGVDEPATRHAFYRRSGRRCDGRRYRRNRRSIRHPRRTPIFSHRKRCRSATARLGVAVWAADGLTLQLNRIDNAAVSPFARACFHSDAARAHRRSKLPRPP